MFEKLNKIKDNISSTLKRAWEPQENKLLLLFSSGIFATLFLLSFPLFACATFTLSVSFAAFMFTKCLKSLHALARDIQALMLDLNQIIRSFKEKLSPQTILVIEHTRKALATLKQEIPDAKTKMATIITQRPSPSSDKLEDTNTQETETSPALPEKKSFLKKCFHYAHSLENILCLFIGISAFATLFLLQYSLIFSVAAGISSSLMSLSIAKTSEFFYRFACDTQKLVKNTQEVAVSLNEHISQEALALMEQAGITIAALETQIPELGKGMRTMKAFNHSRVGSAFGRVLGVKAPDLEDSASLPADKKKKKAGSTP